MKKSHSVGELLGVTLLLVGVIGSVAPLIPLGWAQRGWPRWMPVITGEIVVSMVPAIMAGVVIFGLLLSLRNNRSAYEKKLDVFDDRHQRSCAHILHLLALMDRPWERDDKVFIFPSQWEAQRGLGFLARKVQSATDYSLAIYDQTRDSDSPEFQDAERRVKRCLADFRSARDVVRQNYAPLGCLSSWKEALDF